MERSVKMSSVNKFNGSSNHSDSSFVGLLIMLIVVMVISFVAIFKNGN